VLCVMIAQNFSHIPSLEFSLEFTFLFLDVNRSKLHVGKGSQNGKCFIWQQNP
jgi:hypothetical protein